MKLLLSLLLFLLLSCCEESINITHNHIDKYSYIDLPLEVKAILSDSIEIITNSKIETFYSTDKNYKFFYTVSVDTTGSWLDEVNSNFHRFTINEFHFRLRGNKGHPFILHDSKLYFTQLNIALDSYKDKEFYSIDLKNYLN